MTKYHISPESGRPNICRAEKQDCPVGGSHFENKADAKAYAETQLKEEHGGSLGKMSKKSSTKEQEDYQDGVNHAKDALIGGLDPDALLKTVSNQDSWDKGYIDTLKKASAFKKLPEEEKNRRSFDQGAFCFVCKRPVDHIGEHEALVNAGMVEYDSEYGVVRKTKAYFPAKAKELERKEAEYNANNPMSTEEIMNMAPPASLNKKNDAKKVAFGSEYSIDEKVDALKNFSNTNEYKKIMKEMGYKNPEDSMTQQIINGAYPTAVRSATKKLEGNNKAGMKEYIRQLEEDAYEEEMNNVSRGYVDTPVYSSSSSNYDVEPNLLSDDEILSGDFSFDDEEEDFDFSEDEKF